MCGPALYVPIIYIALLFLCLTLSQNSLYFSLFIKYCIIYTKIHYLYITIYQYCTCYIVRGFTVSMFFFKLYNRYLNYLNFPLYYFRFYIYCNSGYSGFQELFKLHIFGNCLIYLKCTEVV